MAFLPKIIKPCRQASRSPELKKARAIGNHKRGMETSLILDLNVMSKMHEVVRGDVSLVGSGLTGVVDILNKIPFICPTPGFAIQEVDMKYMSDITSSFDIFLGKYCPTYIDHPNATKNYLNISTKPKEFYGLPIAEQYQYSVAYLGILMVQLISKRDTSLSPARKFEQYLEYMVQKANMVGAIEAEVAKYVFANDEDAKDTIFKAFSKVIKKNFKKGGSTAEKILIQSLNSARDIMYYRLTAIMSNKSVDGKLQDTWLLTGDEGLANLSSSIYFVPRAGTSDSQFITLHRHKYQQSSYYWKHCDNIFYEIIGARQVLSKLGGDIDWSKERHDNLLGCISEVEQELAALMSE